MATMVVHGGAGAWSDPDETSVMSAIESALQRGHSVLSTDSPLSAVEEAVNVLEDSPKFNAGTGSCLNFRGDVEMDAAVMRGRDLAAGGVANIRNVKNPVSVARDVMEDTDHVLLGGDGATEFARVKDHEPHDPVTSSRRDQYQTRKEKFLAGESSVSLPKLRKLTEKHPELLGGTVGAVAANDDGDLAAATSTGGVFLKWPGRIGDSPLVGSGTYASPGAAVSATGRGEIITRFTAARRVAEQVSGGHGANEAVSRVLREMADSVGSRVGMVALDETGQPGINHLTERMPHGWVQSEDSIHVSMGIDD